MEVTSTPSAIHKIFSFLRFHLKFFHRLPSVMWRFASDGTCKTKALSQLSWGLGIVESWWWRTQDAQKNNVVLFKFQCYYNNEPVSTDEWSSTPTQWVVGWVADGVTDDWITTIGHSKTLLSSSCSCSSVIVRPRRLLAIVLSTSLGASIDFQFNIILASLHLTPSYVYDETLTPNVFPLFVFRLEESFIFIVEY